MWLLPRSNSGHKKAQTPSTIGQVLLSYVCLLLSFFMCLFVAKAQTGRAYSASELPKKPPPAGPQGPSPVTFKDITASVKLDFVHQGSPTSMKYLPETMGGGVALFDYNNDGLLDVFFTNGALL